MLDIQNNIVILTFQKSVIVQGIEKNLAGTGFNVTTLAGSFDKLNALTQTTGFFLAYLPGDMAGDRAKLAMLSMITETIMESRKGMIIIGEKKDYPDILQAVPEARGFKWLYRPVDINTLKETISQELERNTAPEVKKRILIVDDDPRMPEWSRNG